MSTGRPLLEVLSPGAATTVQGLPRPGAAHRGVSAGGSADALSAALANRLVKNPLEACTLEMTLRGAAVRFLDDTTVAVVGAPFPVVLEGASVPLDEDIRVRAGQVLEVKTCLRGLRCALAVRGGLDARAWGRRMERLDVLEGAGLPVTSWDAPPAPPSPAPLDETHLRVTPGPDLSLFSAASLDALCARPWRVLPTSDRRGIRLEGQPLVDAPQGIVTSGVTAGALQILPSGQPLLLSVDQQTTGGYARLAHVVTADLWRLGQLRPGDVVHFETVSFQHARTLLREWFAWQHPPRPPSVASS